MGLLVENMRRFTEELRVCTRDRKNDLKRIEKSTAECLMGSRNLMVRIGEAHREMAEAQSASLAADHGALQENVASLRNHNQQQIARMREDLRKSLSREVRKLRKSVNTFRTHCRKDQAQLATELRQHAKTWAKLHRHAD